MTTLTMLIVFLLFYCAVAQRANFFRKDYTFIEEVNNFYKIHTIPKTWMEAKELCAREGATLFYPENQLEFDAVFQIWNETNINAIFIGVSSLLVNEVYETIDGIPISDVYNKWYPGQPDNYGGEENCVGMTRDGGELYDEQCKLIWPYICKKTKASVAWNTRCDMPDLTYKYSDQMGKCYKLHTVAKNWTDAYAICRAEQSYLAVINSDVEAEYLKNVAVEALQDKADNLDVFEAIHLGFHNRFNEGWQTVTGTKLESSGYSKWAPGQPDGQSNEDCGSMLLDGKLDQTSCDLRRSFICEHDNKPVF